jgi:hypothetical protein
VKPRDRSINIFSLSMLDVISGALGAFLIIMVVLMPYYNKESIDYQREIRQLQQQSEAAEQRAKAAEQQLADIRFLVGSIKWTTQDQDVDLHVVDPSGAEFSYLQPSIEGRPGELTEDDDRGPGKEIYEVQNAPPGQYRFYVNLFSRNGNPANPQVQGRVFYRDGVQELPPVQLTQEGTKQLLFTVSVGPNGDMTIEP